MKAAHLFNSVKHCGMIFGLVLIIGGCDSSFEFKFNPYVNPAISVALQNAVPEDIFYFKVKAFKLSSRVYRNDFEVDCIAHVAPSAKEKWYAEAPLFSDYGVLSEYLDNNDHFEFSFNAHREGKHWIVEDSDIKQDLNFSVIKQTINRCQTEFNRSRKIIAEHEARMDNIRHENEESWKNAAEKVK